MFFNNILVSSPRPWGCFCAGPVVALGFNVFPTPVGVFPFRPGFCRGHFGLPHARGGVSSHLDLLSSCSPSSPRPWGCFLGQRGFADRATVFPTPVGVFLTPGNRHRRARSLPHARGGVSPYAASAVNVRVSSPRPWGCFSQWRAWL